MQVAEVKALACQLPAETGLPLPSELPGPGRRSRRPGHRTGDLGVRDPPDPGRRRPQALAASVLIFIRDPNFAATATRVLDLYARTYDGVALGPDEYVISSDE